VGTRDLLREFEALLDSRQKHQRGRDFEKLLVKLLHRDGFVARLNAGVAKPRQTDIYAKRFHEEYIIEAKWHDAPIDVSDKDSLKIRLDRVPSHLSGILFSMSGFTESAILDVENRREREIFLIDDYETYFLFSGKLGLAELLKRKRDFLRAQGKILFYKEEETEREAWGDSLELPVTEESIEINGKTSRSFAAHTCLGEFVFSSSIPDASWNQVGGPVVDFLIRVPGGTPESLRKMFGWLHQQFRLSGLGTFSIQQTNVSWFGIGVTEFIEELARQESRYRESGLKEIHHSEEVSYFDRFKEGFLALHGRSRSDSGGEVYSAELLIRLPGVPVDSRPYIELAEAAGEEQPYFIQPSYGNVYTKRLEKRIPVKPLARIVNRSDDREPLVRGLVVENPFFNKPEDAKKLLRDEYSPLDQLSRISVLFCTLSQWHGVEDVVDEYYLRSIDASWGPGGLIIVQPSCLWDEYINKRGRDPVKRAEWLEQLVKEQEKSDKWREHFKERAKPQKKRAKPKKK